MPKLNLQVVTETIDLEAVPGGQVTVVVEPTAAHMERIIAANAISPNSIVGPLSVLISDWNLEGESNDKLPITPENIGKLNYKDINKIAARLQSVLAPKSDTEKKV